MQRRRCTRLKALWRRDAERRLRCSGCTLAEDVSFLVVSGEGGLVLERSPSDASCRKPGRGGRPSSGTIWM